MYGSIHCFIEHLNTVRVFKCLIKLVTDIMQPSISHITSHLHLADLFIQSDGSYTHTHTDGEFNHARCQQVHGEQLG